MSNANVAKNKCKTKAQTALPDHKGGCHAPSAAHSVEVRAKKYAWEREKEAHASFSLQRETRPPKEATLQVQAYKQGWEGCEEVEGERGEKFHPFECIFENAN